jgi:hypothetical protein
MLYMVQGRSANPVGGYHLGQIHSRCQDLWHRHVHRSGPAPTAWHSPLADVSGRGLSPFHGTFWIFCGLGVIWNPWKGRAGFCKTTGSLPTTINSQRGTSGACAATTGDNRPASWVYLVAYLLQHRQHMDSVCTLQYTAVQRPPRALQAVQKQYCTAGCTAAVRFAKSVLLHGTRAA